MNSKCLKILISLGILFTYDLTFANYCESYRAIFFGNDGKDMNLDGNACYYRPRAENGENALFSGGKGGNVNVNNGAVVFDGIQAGHGGSGSVGGNGGDVTITDHNEKSGDIYGDIKSGDGGFGFFKPGKGGNINNVDYK